MAAKTDISKCLSILFGKLKLCIFLSFIVLCFLQPTANYDLAIIEDYLVGNAKIKISTKKQNGLVVIFGKPWQLLLTGSAVPRILTPVPDVSTVKLTKFTCVIFDQEKEK